MIESIPVAEAGLGALLRARFEQAKTQRQLAEQQWLKWLGQYLGRYESNEVSFAEDSTYERQVPGSRAFIRLTRTKVRATDARVMDLLFPGGGQRNWAIGPTPAPELSPQVLAQVRQRLALETLKQNSDLLGHVNPAEHTGTLSAQGRSIQAVSAGLIAPDLEPAPEVLREAIAGEAKRRAEAMSVEIDDQLTEGRYRDEVKKVVHSGHLYGTGWLKGPLAERKPFTQWEQSAQGLWVTRRVLRSRPFFEFVPIWDIYPSSLDVNSIDELEGLYQRYVMNRAEVRKLARREGFDGEAIEAYLREYPKGNAPTKLNFESQLSTLRAEDQGSIGGPDERRYEVLEWTGYTDAEFLEALGVTPLAPETMDYKANLWLLGDQVIKVALFPYDDEAIQTYHRYVFEESDVGILGVGIAEIMNDPQRMFNASIRALLDNMGSSAGPIYEANVDLLSPEELANIHQMYARKVILRQGRGADAQQPALRVHQMQTRIAEFITLAELARELSDEATALPRYSAGNPSVKSGATRTASGLSMMLGQANIVLKEPISNFDEGITKPFLKALYHWNMQFNPKDEIKGDYEIKPTGSSSLIAKEVRSERIEQFAINTLNPQDALWIKRGELNRERAKVNDLEAARFVYSDEEFDRRVKAQSEMEASRDGPSER